MAYTALKKIQARIRELRKKHPHMKYMDVVKKASRELRSEGAFKKPGERVGKVKHKRVKRRKVGRVTPKTTAKRTRKKAPKAKTQTIHTVSTVKRTVSGAGTAYSVRASIERDIAMYNNFIEHTRAQKPKGYKPMINTAKRRLKHLKDQLRGQNRLINDLLR